MKNIKAILLAALLCLPAFTQAAGIDTYPAASALGGTERIPGNQGTSGCTGCTKKITATQIKTFVLTGNAATASALAANGTNCSVGSPALGVDASGNAESCAAITGAQLSMSDVTTNNASTSNHGFLLKLDNTATHFMDGTGAWSTPPASTAFGSSSYTGTGTANRIGTATTNNTNADTMFSASGVSKIPLVLQTSASNTADVFRGEYSDGTAYFVIQRDGNVIIDQKFGAVASKPLQLKYSGSEVCYISYLGLLSCNGGLSVNGLFTAGTNGDVVERDVTLQHPIGSGTSPTAPAGGGTCGTSAPSIAGKDAGFKLTVGSVSATSCTETFGRTWTTAPVCVANAQTTTTALNVATTATTVTVSAATLTPGEVLHVVCLTF